MRRTATRSRAARTTANGFQPPLNKAGGLQSTVGNTSGPGGFKIGYMDGDFAVFLKLLDEVTDTTVLARPKIMCLNRQRASVIVGARVGSLSPIGSARRAAPSAPGRP